MRSYLSGSAMPMNIIIIVMHRQGLILYARKNLLSWSVNSWRKYGSYGSKIIYMLLNTATTPEPHEKDNNSRESNSIQEVWNEPVELTEMMWGTVRLRTLI